MTSEKIPWYYRPWAVILILFFVLGPFGLPLLFKSPSFRKGTKVLLALLTLLYTAYLVWGTVAAIHAILGLAASTGNFGAGSISK